MPFNRKKYIKPIFAIKLSTYYKLNLLDCVTIFAIVGALTVLHVESQTTGGRQTAKSQIEVMKTFSLCWKVLKKT